MRKCYDVVMVRHVVKKVRKVCELRVRAWLWVTSSEMGGVNMWGGAPAYKRA